MQERTRHPAPPEEARLTPEEFLDMLEERPDGEHWELIEGVAIMNPSPTDWHQQIVLNIGTALLITKNAGNAFWSVLPGISTRVPASPRSLPRPALFVKQGPTTGDHTTSDGLILFEVLSRSNNKRDRAWRKRVYSSIPNCQHYVTVSTKEAEVMRYDRSDKWTGAKLQGLDAALDLAAIDATIKLREIYRWTPIE
jgi:Uma2 family endonuclease